MKFIKSLTVMACAAAFLLSTSGAMAASCCVEGKAKGKDCTHPCCVAAHKAGKTCEKCQAEPTCCDTAIKDRKACAHKCCAAALKDKKVCEKCNPPKEKNK